MLDVSFSIGPHRCASPRCGLRETLIHASVSDCGCGKGKDVSHSFLTVVIFSCHYSACCDLKVERMFFIHFDVHFSSLQTADHNPFKAEEAHTVADV